MKAPAKQRIEWTRVSRGGASRFTHDDLMVVHNMGRSCPSCTLWADGYNGIHPHVILRAAFVVSSPDPPDVQHAFAASRATE